MIWCERASFLEEGREKTYFYLQQMEIEREEEGRMTMVLRSVRSPGTEQASAERPSGFQNRANGMTQAARNRLILSGREEGERSIPFAQISTQVVGGKSCPNASELARLAGASFTLGGSFLLWLVMGAEGTEPNKNEI